MNRLEAAQDDDAYYEIVFNGVRTPLEFLRNLTDYLALNFKFPSTTHDLFYCKFYKTRCHETGCFGFGNEYMEFYFYPQVAASLICDRPKFEELLNELDLDWCF